MPSKRKVRDVRVWRRMGLELAALHDLIVHIQTDSDYTDAMDVKTWDKLDKMIYQLNIVRGLAEDRMARYISDWSVRTFYPIDRDGSDKAIAEFRARIAKKAAADAANIDGGERSRKVSETNCSASSVTNEKEESQV